MEFKYFKLIDNTQLVGDVVAEDEKSYLIDNAVEMGVSNEEFEQFVEQRYYFKGMYCPFVKGKPIKTVLMKNRVTTVFDDLEVNLKTQYNKFVKEWYKQRVFHKDPEKMKQLEDKMMTELEAWVERTTVANNQIH